jgi:hypothetical protein
MSEVKISREYDTKLNLRHAKVLTGRKRLAHVAQLDLVGELSPENGASVVDEHDQLSGLASRSVVTEDTRDYIENREPWKMRIPRVGRSWLERLRKNVARYRSFVSNLRDPSLPMAARIDMLKLGRELTAIELNDIREAEEQKRLSEFHREQATRGKQRIINTLTRLRHANVVEREGQRVIRSEVQISYIEYNPLYYRYYVDAQSLPYGVSIMDIQGDGICTDLSASVGHPVRDEIKQVGNRVIGLRYTIEIAATMGVPNQCKFSDLLPLMPTSAPPLAFLTGYSEGKRLRWANLETMPHLLGGGQTLGGKSNMVHNILCCLIARNSPEQVRLALMDMKFDSGIELRRYRAVPHLITKEDMRDSFKDTDELPENVAMTPKEAVAVLQYISKVAIQRGKMFAREDIQNIRQWNRRHPNRKLPHIVAVIDELSNLRTDPEHGDASYKILNKILSTSRAAGIYVIAFTQSSNKRVLDEFIKVNLPGRICFSMADASSSQLFVNDGSAVNLSPAGRAIFKHGTDKYMAQTPFIEPRDIQDVLANAAKGKLTAYLSSRPVLPEEIIEWAVEHNNSSIAARDAWMHFGSEQDRIEKATLESLLKEMEGKDYRVGDQVYQVLPGAGNKPRIVVLIQNADVSPVDPESQDGTQDTARGFTCEKCGAPREETPCEWCGTTE